MKLHFPRTNGPIDDAIDRLIGQAGGVRRPEYVREMIIAALLAGQENEESADLKLMNTTLKEMRFTSKVFGPYRSVKGQVCQVVLPPNRAHAACREERLASDRVLDRDIEDQDQRQPQP